MNSVQNSSVFRRIFGKSLVIVLLAGMVVILLYTFCMQYFTLHTIEVVGEGVHIDVDKSKIAANILFINTQKIRSDLLASNNQLEDAKVTKKYPDAITLTVILRKPVARLTTDMRTIIIDARGVVLGFTRPQDENLPLLTFGVPDQIDGTTITNPLIQSGIAIIQSFDPVGVIGSIAPVNSSSVRVNYQKTSIFFPLKTDYSASVATLQILLNRFRMKGTMPTSIDLRFDKPVIKM